ncbi:MAG: leucine-rich repeat protein [Lachnospiraceae bacterium]|nr:leucine-rich repeat protein [Lachnospiraceae bacterium]
MSNKKRYLAWLVVLALVISTVYVPGTKVKAAGTIGIALENGATLLTGTSDTAVYSANGKEVYVKIGKYKADPFSFTPITLTAGGGPMSGECDKDTFGEYAVYIEYEGEVQVDLIINGARESNRASGSYTNLPGNFDGATLNISVEIGNGQGGDPNNNPPQQEIFPEKGEIVFNMQGYTDAKVEYKLSADTDWTVAVASGSAIRLSGFTSADTGKGISVRVSGQELDDYKDPNTNKHRNRVIVQKDGSNQADEIDVYDDIKTESGYTFTYYNDTTYRFYLELRDNQGGQGGNGGQGGEPGPGGNFVDSIEVWIGETCVVPHDITSAGLGDIVLQPLSRRNMYVICETNDYIVYGIDDRKTVDTNKDIDHINFVSIRPKSKEVTLEPIRAYGTGNVELLASLPKDMMGDDNIDANRKSDITIKAVTDSADPAFGYSFYGDTTKVGKNESEGGIHPSAKITFTITDGALGRKGEGGGSTVTMAGGMHLSYFYISEIKQLNIGTSTAPVENVMTLSYRGKVSYNDTIVEGENYVAAEIDSPVTCYFTDAFMKGNDKNEDKIYQGFDFCRAQGDAEVDLHDMDGTTQMFDNPEGKMKLRVMTGGNFVLDSDQKIDVPDTQAGYYSASGALEVFEIKDGLRMQDAVKLVDCEYGDHSDSTGRYIYTEANEGKSVYFRSTTATLWNCGVAKLENGHFGVEAATGIQFVNTNVDRQDPNYYTYQFEEGTLIKFTLVPDPGYQYKPGTFCFMDGMLVENSDYVQAVPDEPGAYVYCMEDHNLSITCEFEYADDDIKLDASNISYADISMGENELAGSMEFSVKENKDASEEVKAEITEAAGEGYEILSVLDLSLSQVINTVTNENAWVTPLSTLDKPMDVYFEMKDATGENVEYDIVRIHDGKTEKLGATYDAATKSLKFETDKYSTYAIVQKGTDAQNPDAQDPDDVVNPDENQGGDSNQGGNNGGTQSGGDNTSGNGNTSGGGNTTGGSGNTSGGSTDGTPTGNDVTPTPDPEKTDDNIITNTVKEKGKTITTTIETSDDGTTNLTIETKKKNGEVITKTYTENKDGSAKITKYDTKATNVTLSSKVEVNGEKYPVTVIGKKAMSGNKTLESVTIAKGITTIGFKAFAGDTALKTIVLPSTIKKISANAFKGVPKGATFIIKGTKDDFERIKKLLKKSGLKLSRYNIVWKEEK